MKNFTEENKIAFEIMQSKKVTNPLSVKIHGGEGKLTESAFQKELQEINTAVGGALKSNLTENWFGTVNYGTQYGNKRPVREEAKEPKAKFKVGDKVERDDGSEEGEIVAIGAYDDVIGGYRYRVKQKSGGTIFWNEGSTKLAKKTMKEDVSGWKNSHTKDVWIKLSNDEKAYNATLKIAKDAKDLEKRAKPFVGSYSDSTIDWQSIFNAHAGKEESTSIKSTLKEAKENAFEKVVAYLKKKNVDKDLVSPNYVADVAKRLNVALSSDDVVKISDEFGEVKSEAKEMLPSGYSSVNSELFKRGTGDGSRITTKSARTPFEAKWVVDRHVSDVMSANDLPKEAPSYFSDAAKKYYDEKYGKKENKVESLINLMLDRALMLAESTSIEARKVAYFINERFIPILETLIEADEKSDDAEAGFDLTDITASAWKKVLSTIGADAKPIHKPGKWIWKGKDITLVTGNDPITGKYGTEGGRKDEKDYASYIGLSGSKEQVEKVFAMIKSLADNVKDSNPHENKYISEAKEDEPKEEKELSPEEAKKALEKVQKGLEVILDKVTDEDIKKDIQKYIDQVEDILEPEEDEKDSEEGEENEPKELEPKEIEENQGRISVKDNIFDDITIEELITTLQSNESEINERTVRKVYAQILKMKTDDANEVLKNNMKFIIDNAQ